MSFNSQRFILYIGIAVILAVAGVTVSILVLGNTEEAERQVKIEMIIKTPNGEENVISSAHYIAVEPDVKTLGELLLQENIHYGPNDVKDIFNGVFAEQQNDQLNLADNVSTNHEWQSC